MPADTQEAEAVGDRGNLAKAVVAVLVAVQVVLVALGAYAFAHHTFHASVGTAINAAVFAVFSLILLLKLSGRRADPERPRTWS